MKRDATVGAPRELRGAGEEDFRHAEQLREVVRRQADAPLGQIEAELEPHRPRQPRIAARLRRPHAFDQPAEHDAVDMNEPRLDGAEDVHARAGPSGAAADAVRNRGLEQIGVVAGRGAQVGALLGDVLERFGQLHAVFARESGGLAIMRRQGLERLRMQRGDCGERVRALDRFRAAPALRRAARPVPARHRDRRRESSVRGSDRCSVVFRGAEGRERLRKPCRTGARTRPAQHGHFQRGDCVRVRAGGRAKPEARMLQQREQRDRLESAQRGLRDEPREHAGLGIGQAIAAGIVGLDVPALERRRDAARQRAIRRHQRGGLVLVHRLAQRHRDRERLVLGIGGLDDRDARECRVARGRIAVLPPSARSPRAGATPPMRAFRAGRSRRAQRPRRAQFRSGAAAPCIASCGCPNDGRLHHAPAVLDLADQLPGALIEIGIEPGQHHGAVRQLRDGGEQARGRRHRAGGAGGDHRARHSPQGGCARPRSADRAARPARSCLRLRAASASARRRFSGSRG